MLLNSAPAGVVDESRRIGLEQMAERYAHDVRQLEMWMFENAAAPSAASGSCSTTTPSSSCSAATAHQRERSFGLWYLFTTKWAKLFNVIFR